MRLFLSKCVVPVALFAVIAGCKDAGESEGSGGSSASDTSSAQTGSSSGAAGGAGDGGAGSGGDSAQNSGSSSGSGGAGDPGWTIVPLVDDESDPDVPIWHAGNSLVTGIHFSSIDEGLITLSGDEQTSLYGGAVYRATQNAVTDLLVRGEDGGGCISGSVNFGGIEETTDGFVAVAHACDLFESKDGGASFENVAVGVGDPFGIERVLVYRQSEGKHTILRDTGVVSVTDDTPGPNAIWDDIWAPAAIPTIPNPVPQDQCHTGPISNNVPQRLQVAYASPDASLIAYASMEGDEGDPAVCISRDGGESFFPKMLPVTSLGYAASGVTFTSATDGIAWWASRLSPDETYIVRTTDAGETWTAATLPESLDDLGIELNGAFFAPDGEHGWIVGFDYDHSIALMLRTTDGGATWDDASGDLAAKVGEAGGSKLFTGFALDADHVWVGGEYGVFLSNSAGGL